MPLTVAISPTRALSLILLPIARALIVHRGFVIALDTPSAAYTARHASRYLGIPNVTVFPAINGTAALQLRPSLSLYTQYLLYFHARHDHMQLSTAPMLGCLLSHMRLWSQSVAENRTIAVFEEDAIFDTTSTLRFHALLADLRAVPWDILMLESGSVIAQGP